MTRSFVFPALLACLLATRALALDGDPDPAFGDSGQLIIEHGLISGSGAEPTGDVVTLGDGRLLWVTVQHDGSVWLGRVLHDGSIDAAFGGDGTGRIAFSDCASPRSAYLAADDDGGVVFWAGTCLHHVAADGTVDAKFGANPLPLTFRAAALARDHAGRYVLAGSEGPSYYSAQWTVYRFGVDGTLDTGFGDGGKVTVPVPAVNDQRDLAALAIRPDDRIVLAGSRNGEYSWNLAIAQLASDGTLDPQWNGAGLVDVGPPPEYTSIRATALALDADGSLVVAGHSSNGNVGCCLLLARFDTAGQLVPGFGLRHILLDGIESSFAEARDSVGVLADGRLLVGTTAFPYSSLAGNHRTQFILVRANADGTLDADFGDGGSRGYTFMDPTGSMGGGDYNQLHAMRCESGSALLFGRAFFEEGNSSDYIRMLRVTLDTPSTADWIFVDGFEA